MKFFLGLLRLTQVSPSKTCDSLRKIKRKVFSKRLTSNDLVSSNELFYFHILLSYINNKYIKANRNTL